MSLPWLLGSDTTPPASLNLPLQRLRGSGGLGRAPASGAVWSQGPYRGLRWARSLVGQASLEVAAKDIEATARAWYMALFEILNEHGLKLARCWNTIPSINGEECGLEHYRAFSVGRSLAFEAAFGAEAWRAMPAATGVGGHDALLTVSFVAVDGAATHFENPRQVPAYRYPEVYGPRPPSFARATHAAFEDQDLLWVAGTSAVRSHHSVAPGDALAQTAETLLNLQSLGDAAGVSPLLAPRAACPRDILVYLRRASDLDAVSDHLSEHWLGPQDTVSYLLADICRAELEVEIELVTPWST